jgi:hypothetical protein
LRRAEVVNERKPTDQLASPGSGEPAYGHASEKMSQHSNNISAV